MIIVCPLCDADHELGEFGYMTKLCEDCRLETVEKQSEEFESGATTLSAENSTPGDDEDIDDWEEDED